MSGTLLPHAVGKQQCPRHRCVPAARREPGDQFPELDQLGGVELRDLVHEKLRAWHPALRRLVASSDPDTVNAIRIRSASPVEPWPTGPVTLLGDAIHNMTPMAGIGANTALRDAELLRRQLIAVRDGREGLVPAVREYERQMLDYGFGQ